MENRTPDPERPADQCLGPPNGERRAIARRPRAAARLAAIRRGERRARRPPNRSRLPLILATTLALFLGGS
ncbi:MAG: hypothetical protein ABJC39_07595, partial [Chloroflexota bacterium]